MRARKTFGFLSHCFDQNRSRVYDLLLNFFSYELNFISTDRALVDQTLET